MKFSSKRQQPRERLSWTIDYSAVMSPGDNVNTSQAIVEPAGELIVDNVTPIPSEHRVRFWVGPDGIDDSNYKITILTQTVDGRTYEDDVTFKIRGL